MRPNTKEAAEAELALFTKVVQVKRAMLFMVWRSPRFDAWLGIYTTLSTEDKSHELLTPAPDVLEGDIRETRWFRGRDCAGWSEDSLLEIWTPV